MAKRIPEDATALPPSPFRLLNRVWDGGYEWLPVAGGKRLLVGRGAHKAVVRSESALYRWNARWAPVEVPTVCREFAALGTDELSIADFASKYGDLFKSHPVSTDLDGNVVSGSERSAWIEAIEDVQFWLGTWDLVRERKSKLLRERIQFCDDGPWITHPKGLTLVGGYIPRVVFPPSNVLKAARFAVRDAINDRLETYPVRAALSVTPSDSSEFAISFRASGLLAVIWMQIAREAAGAYRLQRCEACNDYFYPRRTTARFCSDVCRATQWAHNRREA